MSLSIACIAQFLLDFRCFISVWFATKSLTCIAQFLLDFRSFYFCLICHHESLNRLYCPVSVRFSFSFVSVWFATKSLSIPCIAQFLLDFRFLLFMSDSPPL